MSAATGNSRPSRHFGAVNPPAICGLSSGHDRLPSRLNELIQPPVTFLAPNFRSFALEALMSVELLGFIAGISAVFGAGMVLVSHEHWKAIRAAYNRDKRPAAGRNALIWPSH